VKKWRWTGKTLFDLYNKHKTGPDTPREKARQTGGPNVSVSVTNLTVSLGLLLELSIRYTKMQSGNPRVTATWPTDVRNRLPINEITRNQAKHKGLGKGPRCHLECGWALNQSQAMLPDCSQSLSCFFLLAGSTVQASHGYTSLCCICISAAWKFSYCTRNLCQRGRHFIVCARVVGCV